MISQNHMKKTIIKLIPWALLAFPALTFAATTTFGDILITISHLINSVVVVLIALGVLVFIWGVIMYIIAKSEDQKKNARDLIIYGVIGLFAITAVWGLV